jgi:very-short-patch-repair endonuclease
VPVDGAVRAVVEVASRQHAVISLAQLERAGLGRHAVAYRVKAGWLRPLHRGVYLVGPLETEHSRAMAAALATGGVVSSYPAAVLWGLRPPREGPIDVIVPLKLRNRPGIRIHQAALHPRDITRRHGIPTTSAARTILDLAASDSLEAERALNEARIARLVSDRSLNEQFSRYPRHKGTAALKEATRTEPAFTRSEAERRALELIRRAGLPAPEVNQRVEGYEVDLVWRQERVIVEIDGYAFHSTRSSFEQDRRRDQRLITAGWRVVRVTWRQLTERPEAVAVMLATALGA